MIMLPFVVVFLLRSSSCLFLVLTTYLLRIRLEGFCFLFIESGGDSFYNSLVIEWRIIALLLHIYFLSLLRSTTHQHWLLYFSSWEILLFLERVGEQQSHIQHGTHTSSHAAPFFPAFTFTFAGHTQHHTWERFFSSDDLWFLWYKFRFKLFLGCCCYHLCCPERICSWANFFGKHHTLLCTRLVDLLRWAFGLGKHSKHKTSTGCYYLWAVFIIILPNSLIFSTTLSNMCFSRLLFTVAGPFPRSRNCTQTLTVGTEVFPRRQFKMILLLQLLLEIITPEHDFRILHSARPLPSEGACSKLKRKFQFRSVRGQ